MRLLSTDNGKIKPEQKQLQVAGSDAKDPNVTPTRKQMNVINKTTIDLNTHSGERGEATVWWEDVKQELENAYPGADRRTKNQWLPLIRKALKNYKTGIDRINEYIQEMKIRTTWSMLKHSGSFLQIARLQQPSYASVKTQNNDAKDERKCSGFCD